jgi:hypothetical protein
MPVVWRKIIVNQGAGKTPVANNKRKKIVLFAWR